MILFVLYIEPLIREMSPEVSGANVGIETIKVLGYESDRVFAAVDRFCADSYRSLRL
jgi:hypothetical protein